MISHAGFAKAVTTIGGRLLLQRLRSPLTSLLELSYPCLAVLILLLLRVHQTASDATAGSQSEEYGAWSLIWVSVFLLPNLRLVQVLMEEKETQVRDFIQVYGASDFAYWCGLYFGHLIISVAQSTLITILCRVLLQKGFFDGLFFLTIVFMMSCVSLSILITSLMDSTRLCLFIYTLIYLLLFAPYMSLADLSESSTADTISSLLAPPSALACGLDRFIGGFRITSSNDPTSLESNLGRYCKVQPSLIFIFLLLDGAIFLAIGWYFYQIRPGRFGIPKRWTFIFQKHYWINYGREWAPRRKPWATPKAFLPLQLVSDLFQPNYKQGVIEPLVSVEEVHKIFVLHKLSFKRLMNWICLKLDVGVRKPPEGFHALKGVSFTVYPGEIAVLMGRNGSGKTTLMSILSGLLDASSGNVTVAGYDVHRMVTQARKSVGFAPQSTFFLDGMTVLEQFQFAARLKNIPSHIAACDIEVILKMLDMYDKMDWMPRRLSEGEKKRISIGLAFLGNPKVVLIDDLSTGLDVLSRRVVWNALREMKRSRAIIVVSHCPEEACQIADRVLLLDKGQLKCDGSPVFLKSRFETGYTLTLIDTEEFEDSRHQVSDIVLSRCPNASLTTPASVEISYTIPFTDAAHIRALLQDLEYNMPRLGLRKLSIGTTTFSEVLEKACEDTTADAERRKARQAEIQSQLALTSYLHRMLSTDGGATAERPPPGVSTLRVVRRVSEPLSHEISAKSTESSHWSSLAISADTALWSQGVGTFIESKIGYIGNPTVFHEARARFRLARTKYNRFARNVQAMFWKRFHIVRKDGLMLQVQPIFPAAFVLLFCMFFASKYKSSYQNTWTAPEPELTTGSEAGEVVSTTPHKGWNIVMMLSWAIMGCELIPAGWANYVTHERATGSKSHQHAAGMPLFLYWLGELCFDLVLFFVSGGLVLLVLLMAQPMLTSTVVAPLFLLGFVLFALSSACGAFVLSFCFNSGTTIQAVMIAGAVVIPCLVGAFHAVQPSAYTQWMTWILLLVPHCAFAQICYTIAFECTVIGDSLKDLSCPPLFSAEYCLYPCLYMAGETIVYFLCVVFIDALQHDPHLRAYIHKMRCLRIPRLPKKNAFLVIRRHRRASIATGTSENKEPGFLRTLRDHFGDSEGGLPSTIKEDSPEGGVLGRRSFGSVGRRVSLGVNQERRFVQTTVIQYKKLKTRRNRRESDIRARKAIKFTREGKRECILVAQGISKWEIEETHTIRYLPRIRCLRHAKRAINEKSFFSVKNMETFGVFGLNGSGMSSLMNMLAGRVMPSQGTLWLEGVNLSSQPYYRFGRMGFCSQVDSGLESRMSGREILEMFGRISMIDQHYLRRTVIPEALRLVGLRDMKNRPVDEYSQGDKRKLSFILSLINGPRLLLLDSPTAGVDLFSRRRIWSVINQTKRELGRAIVLSSPDPSDCEILCDRVAGLKSGRIQMIGDMSGVLARMGAAYQVDINICAYDQIAVPSDASSVIGRGTWTGHDWSTHAKASLVYLSLHKSCKTDILKHFTHPKLLSWANYKDHDAIAIPAQQLVPGSGRPNSGRPGSGKSRDRDLDSDSKSEEVNKKRLARLIAHLNDITHTLVRDHAERVIEALLKELERTFPGSEVVELQETRCRILVPKGARRVMDLEDSIEDSDESSSVAYSDDDDLTSSMRSNIARTSTGRASLTPVRMSTRCASAREVSVEAPAATMNSTVPTTIPADGLIDDDDMSASDLCRVGSLTELTNAVWKSNRTHQESQAQAEWIGKATTFPYLPSTLSEGVSQSTTDHSLEEKDQRLVPTIENVFHWFDKRRHALHLMELRVSMATIETHMLLQSKRKCERAAAAEG
eukprot:Blabericola_migrator_1__8440@NODE_43_length_16904_cov_225_701966_g39_i0_p1_GENE_NODE_43_length_16904_cov_225_701966_g39_i0NODE_43_length_16904_cov_225_701966_g39_i0_p1_ORF_typecomplete_len1843_score264_56ABC_tran/PF00005_27/6_2e30ABC_tran/PF00005_27/3_4e18ABC2_membrane_3/PF12698_7/8e18ABC2_membrane_3/PF12698_7/1_8e16AAA_21/PF13304_6/3e09AAA_21/PF13304_6/2_3ABC2_membrane/PF01061_24/0_0012ABC2_membrane/PF01061_24/3_8e02ABC2_membrane/PF01061_24/0_00019SMC_N/PF02463_19/12SMC_N/PF02463_19/0_038SMC_N/